MMSASTLNPKLRRADQAYETIRSWLLEGRWQPGEIISTYALSELLGLSRSPIQEALKRLEQEGLVEIIPQVGCRILVPTSEDVAEVFTIRAVLEGLAAERAATEITQEELGELRQILAASEEAAQARDGKRYEALNRAFHSAIVRAARMPRLEKLLRNLWMLGRYQLASVPFLGQRAPLSLQEHREILKALEDRDPKRARETLEAHLRACSRDFSLNLPKREERT
jgi:DNA-binding GntR family transcriptional regulator